MVGRGEEGRRFRDTREDGTKLKETEMLREDTEKEGRKERRPRKPRSKTGEDKKSRARAKKTSRPNS